MSKPKVKLIENRRIVDNKRYLKFDSELTPGIIEDWENWGFEPELANYLAWCIKNRKEIEKAMKKDKSYE